MDSAQETTPREEYKTITVNLKTFMRFVKAARDVRKKDSKVTNSRFLDSLLDLHT